MSTGTMCHTEQKRAGAVTFKGNPLTLVGPALTIGAALPAFQILGQDLSPVTSQSLTGKVLLLSAVPSVDTPVCDAQVRRFNEEAVKFPGVEIVNISMDLPFAQKRWCGAAGISRVRLLSDHKEASFGKATGTLIQELRLLTRALFVVDRSGTIRHVEYVPEVTSHPNYQAALDALRSLSA